MGDINFQVISIIENSNKFPKTKFWKEELVEDVVTLRLKAHATLVTMKQQKNKVVEIKFHFNENNE